MKKYRIVFVGAGNVATNLALALQERHQIIQVYSRSEESARILGEKINALYTASLAELIVGADVYIFSVKDAALPEILPQLPALNGIWVHTSGSTPMAIFDTYTQKYGVFYPLQTFSKEKKVDFSVVPICLEASDDQSYQILKDIANGLSRNVVSLDSDKRKYLHLSAVFVCNFVNRLYDIGAEIMQSQGLPFELLLPLIDETARKVHSLSPYDAQTGPAVRFDENIINTHLSLLNDDKLREIYQLLSNDIHDRHSNEL